MLRVDGYGVSKTRPVTATGPLPAGEVAVTSTPGSAGDRLETVAPRPETPLSDIVARAKVAQAAAHPADKPHVHGLFGRLIGTLHGAFQSAEHTVGHAVTGTEHFLAGLKKSAFDDATFVLGEIHQWAGVLDTQSAPALDRHNLLRRREASNYVHEHGAQFEAALAALAPQSRREIQDVNDQLGDDWLARESLMKVVLNQTLPGSPALLETLTRMVSEPLGKGIDRKALLAETLQEIENPARVTQGYKQTCESASTQIMLAERNPAEYARLLAGLASVKGEVALANGDIIRRDPHWDASSLRGLPDDLLQPAFAAYAAPGYSNEIDADRNGVQGLTDAQLGKLLSGVFNTPYQAYRREQQLPGEEGGVPASLDQRMAELQKALGAGEHVPVWLDFGAPPGHVVLVEGIQDGVVTIDNPFGFRQTMSLKDFEQQLHSTYAPRS